MKEKAKELFLRFKNKEHEEILEYFLKEYKDSTVLASSVGLEDQVLTDMILKIRSKARIFTLDTGRLPQETYDVINATMKKYDMRFEICFPERTDIEEMQSNRGPNLFYESIENRKQCCYIRKIIPLKRVLKTVSVWITGLRKEQSITRTKVEKVEWDESNGLIKVNPIADWTIEQVWEYIKHHDVPYNVLHDKGYPSIGCAPCTRAIKPGEDIRAGRWWWEEPENKECGLHLEEKQ